MNILIAGAGRVGFRLAKALSRRHNVTLIDNNTEAIERIQDNIDVLAIAGDVEDPKSYKTIEDKSFDIFIAVTNEDEANLISTIIMSEKIEVKRKIIRLKKEFFAKSSIASKIGITDVVFPYVLTAQSIERLLNYPKANNIKAFRGTNNKLVSIRIDKELEFLSLKQIDNSSIKVIGLNKGKELHIFNGKNELKKGDILYLFGDAEEIRNVCDYFSHSPLKKIKNVAIFGADILGIEIAKALIENKVDVKLIEKDFAKCDQASETLRGKAIVVNSKYGDFGLYDDERIKNADMVVAATDNDEENIIKCVEAKEHGVPKVVAINNDNEYYNLMHSLGVSVVRGPKSYTYYSILEKIDSNDVVTERYFCGGHGVVFVRQFKDMNIHFRQVKTSDTIVLIILNDKIIELNENITLNGNITLLVFTLSTNEIEVSKWIHNL